MQYIICVESNSQCQSDYIYVKSLIRFRYKLPAMAPKFSPVFLGGKNNYDKCLFRISTLVKKYGSSKDSVVIMCFDTDLGGDSEKYNESINRYCLSNGYQLVWFNRVVEEVFLGKKISSKDKRRTAEDFLRKNMVEMIDWDKCLHTGLTKEPGTSNIVSIFDGLLPLNK